MSRNHGRHQSRWNFEYVVDQLMCITSRPIIVNDLPSSLLAQLAKTQVVYCMNGVFFQVQVGMRVMYCTT